MTEYRIRQDRVRVCFARHCRLERRFIAERRSRFLRLIDVWWPVENGDWRYSEAEALRDAKADAELHAPLNPPKYFDLVERQ